MCHRGELSKDEGTLSLVQSCAYSTSVRRGED